MCKFEVGSVYYARSACNHDCVFLMKVLSRTEKSVKAEFSGEGSCPGTTLWRQCSGRSGSILTGFDPVFFVVQGGAKETNCALYHWTVCQWSLPRLCGKTQTPKGTHRTEKIK